MIQKHFSHIIGDCCDLSSAHISCVLKGNPPGGGGYLVPAKMGDH